MKNRVLTLFFVLLTLSVGLTFINLQTSPYNQAFALDREINDAIKKACPSYENPSGIEGIIPNALKSCLPAGNPTNPPPNGDTSTLTINTFITTQCERCNVLVLSLTSGQILSYDKVGTGNNIIYHDIPVGERYLVQISGDAYLGRAIVSGNDCNEILRLDNAFVCAGIKTSQSTVILAVFTEGEK